MSKKYRGEYSAKKQLYAEMGVLYYAVYSSRRRKKLPLEIYQLVNGEYHLLSGNSAWMPEIGLGLGCDRGIYQGILREWLYWYDETGQRYPTFEERADQAEKRADETAEQLADLLRWLRDRGIDPDAL